MILLIHLLQHLGIPSGIAIAVIVAGRKLLKGGIAQLGGRRDQGRDRDRGRDRGRRHSRAYR